MGIWWTNSLRRPCNWRDQMFSSRKQKLRKKTFPLVVDYNPRLPNISLIIKKHFHLLESNQVVREIFPAKSVIPAYHRTKSLKDILAPSKFKRSRNHDEAEICGCFKLRPFGLNKRCEFRSKKRINFNVP